MHSQINNHNPKGCERNPNYDGPSCPWTLACLAIPPVAQHTMGHASNPDNPTRLTTMAWWRQVGCSFDISWLLNYPAGAKFPPPESTIKGKSFLQVADIAVAQIHDAHGGLGIPNSFLYWHWAMVFVFLVSFSFVFIATSDPSWVTLIKKLLIYFNVWESLGLGVIHGPLHQKLAPPFQDWWYRMTPGTMKYSSPFFKRMSMKRNLVDVSVEGVLTYIAAAYALCLPTVTPAAMLPVALCSVYEFIFDYGQHMHTYGTQNMHMFVCCCFPSLHDQITGMQLFLTFFYFCSGACKLGPTFQYMFTSNLLSAKFMVDVPWANAFRTTFFVDVANHDYRLTPAAWWLATAAASIEMTVPLLAWTSSSRLIAFSVFTFMCMHAFIISTLIIDVFVWNFADAIWYIVLYGIIGTAQSSPIAMHPILKLWLGCHACYVLYGHVQPDSVPYVVAHRHAAGNWSQGIIILKKDAAHKLANIRSHAGLPAQAPGWIGEWFSFHAFFAYVYNWNLPSKMLFPLVVDAMGARAPSNGMFHSTGDYLLIHSVLFFDSLVAHLRFDGLSNLALFEELGRVCGFDESECLLAWSGAFPSFMLPSPSASWKLVDAKCGVLKEGKYTVADVMDPAWKKPSDLHKTRLLDLVASKKVD